MRLCKAADVAAALGVTQSSVSHSLRRLRDSFGDELFIRKPHGLEPAAFAIDVEPRVRQSVDSLNTALSGRVQFDPESSNQTLRISALDHSMATLLPHIVARVNTDAPSMQLTIHSMGRDSAVAAFPDGDIDRAVGYFWNPPESLIKVPLVQEPYLIIGNRNNPLLRKPMPLVENRRAHQLIVTPRRDFHSVVDRALRECVLRRNVVFSVTLFFPALTIICNSDLTSALPATMVRTGSDWHFRSRPFQFASLMSLRSAIVETRKTRPCYGPSVC